MQVLYHMKYERRWVSRPNVTVFICRFCLICFTNVLYHMIYVISI
nr:MAG TPA: MYST MYST family zinc finger domain [Caudoviricetes sp.]